MKKLLALVLIALVTLCPLTAWAEGEDDSDGLILSGNVVAGETVSITAPFGGSLNDFTLKAGDSVEAGDALFALGTTKVYAPCDGVVGAVWAQPGDTASYLEERYGGLLHIEPTNSLVVETNTSGAYNRAANKFIHIGETVYLKKVNSKRTAEGHVISVSGSNYTVQIDSGNVNVGNKVKLYRGSRTTKNRIGQGTVSRMNPVAVKGEGSVMRILVEEGQEVKRGDLLCEMVTGTLDELSVPEDNRVTAPQSGVIASVDASAGASVSKDQVLAKLRPTSSLRLEAKVSEIDLSRVKVGDQARLEFESVSDRMYQGRVSAISAIGTAEEGSSDEYVQYTVTIEFTPDEMIREGMSASVAFGE